MEAQNSETVFFKADNGITIATGLSEMTIKIDNGNLLDTQVAEALAEAYERGVKQVDIINALNNLKK